MRSLSQFIKRTTGTRSLSDKARGGGSQQPQAPVYSSEILLTFRSTNQLRSHVLFEDKSSRESTQVTFS